MKIRRCEGATRALSATGRKVSAIFRRQPAAHLGVLWPSVGWGVKAAHLSALTQQIFDCPRQDRQVVDRNVSDDQGFNPVVFVPQHISDPSNIRPGHLRMRSPSLVIQPATGLRNDFQAAFNSASHLPAGFEPSTVNAFKSFANACNSLSNIF